MALTKVSGGLLGNLSVGTDNVALGNTALDSLTSGQENVAIGSASLTAVTSGQRNVGVGVSTLQTISTANFNTALGHAAARDITGSGNTALGDTAMVTATTGDNNTAVGHQSLKVNTASNNTAVGKDALTANTTGTQNTAVGAGALDAASTSNYNTALGYAALTACEASNNTAIGWQSLDASTSGSDNVAVGYDSGSSVTSGYANTILGYLAGAYQNSITTGSDNVVIGAFARTSSATVSNEIAIGRYVLGQGANTATLGISGNGVSIAINGSTTTWTAHSDERLKKNIETSTAGLDFIKDLRPITYQWKNKNEISSEFVNYYDADSEQTVHGDKDHTYHGFIAQEVKEVIDNHPEIKNGQSMWREGPDGIQHLGDSAFIPMLVNAVKELSAKCDSLQNEINILKGE